MIIELSPLKGLFHAIHAANLWWRSHYDSYSAGEETEKKQKLRDLPKTTNWGARP